MSRLLVVLLMSASLFSAYAGENGSVNSFGAYATEVPISVPAYHGLEPSLKLSYRSGGRRLLGRPRLEPERTQLR